MTTDTLTRADLTEAVFQAVGLSRNESAQMVEDMLEEICSALAKGETVKLSSFGTFAVRQKSQRMGRNPKTGDEVPIAPRRVLVFRPSHVLKAVINGQTPVFEAEGMSAVPAGIAVPRTKSAEAFRTISEVAVELDVPQHVLRFWETRFTQVKPVKRAGGRRYYRPEDVDLLRGIQALLYSDGLTIKGVQKVLRERGLRQVCEIGRGEARFTRSMPSLPENAPEVWQEEATHARAVIATLARVHAEDPIVEIESALDEETRVRLEILLADLQQSKARLRAAAGR